MAVCFVLFLHSVPILMSTYDQTKSFRTYQFETLRRHAVHDGKSQKPLSMHTFEPEMWFYVFLLQSDFDQECFVSVGMGKLPLGDTMVPYYCFREILYT